MMRSAEYLVDAVRAVGIRSAVEELAQMRRRNANGRLNRSLQQRVQGENPVRLYTMLYLEGKGYR